MSDTTTNPSNEGGQSTDNPGGSGSTTTGSSTPGAGDQFKTITSQDELNRIVTARVDRERSKFADYDDLKAKAAKLDEIEEANKSEIQKASDRAAAAEDRATKAESAALRLRIAAKHGISDEDADLFLTGTDEASLTKQAERLAGRAADQAKKGTQVPR